MSAGNLTDEDLKHILTLLGSSAADNALRAKIEEDLPKPPPPAELKLALTAGKKGVQILSAPPGATVDFALCSEEGGGAKLFEPKGLKVGAIVEGKPGHEWVDAHVAGSSEWWSDKHGRIKVEVGVTPPPPPPPPSGFKRGVGMGGSTRPAEVADAKLLGPNPAVRLENPSETAAFTSAGVAVVYLSSGGTSVNTPRHFSAEARAHRSAVLSPRYEGDLDAALTRYGYSSGGVKSLSTSAIVADALAVWKKHPDIWCYEYLNEPAGNWFWGSGAESAANAAAYAAQLKALHEAFAKLPSRPLLLASWDGGHSGNNAWGKAMLAADPHVCDYFDHPTMHPYDGGSANPDSTLVHWSSVEACERETGKKPFPTECGRPLLASTGDSPKSTEAQQAKADAAYVRKGREQGCPGVLIYGYKGDSSPCYAIFHGNDTPRLAVAAIAAA